MEVSITQPTRARPSGAPGSWPATRTLPEVGRISPTSILSVVVLPAPLGPRKP
ncbi:MAG: hypothetical protein JF924_01925 [Candidatus Dormibacteraeota bacterium]|nr:hypothetical protein [Candidatus Dormibacteraeota bacterium]